MNDRFTILDQQRVYDGFLKLDRYTLRQKRFDGTETPTFHRDILVASECVGVLLYDPIRDAVVLVEQARLAPLLKGIDTIQTEIVAGHIDPGDTPLTAVYREVQEESGCAILGDPEHIATVLTSPGINTERLHLYCALVDATTAGGLFGLVEEHEDIRVLVLPYAEYAARLADGRITNLFTLSAGFWLALNRDRLRASAV